MSGVDGEQDWSELPLTEASRRRAQAALAAAARVEPLSPSAKARIRAGVFHRSRARRPSRAALLLGLSFALLAAAAAAATTMIAEPGARPTIAPRTQERVQAAPEPLETEPIGAIALRDALQALALSRAEDAQRIAKAARTAHPDGPFAPELMMVEVQSLLAQEREDEALELLSAIDLRAVRGLDLIVLRAELRARAGRCDLAVADRAVALSEKPSPEQVVRLFGLCRGAPR